VEAGRRGARCHRGGGARNAGRCRANDESTTRGGGMRCRSPPRTTDPAARSSSMHMPALTWLHQCHGRAGLRQVLQAKLSRGVMAMLVGKCANMSACSTSCTRTKLQGPGTAKAGRTQPSKSHAAIVLSLHEGINRDWVPTVASGMR